MTTRRTMRNPEYFLGKIVNQYAWNIPDGYATCAMTGKFHRFQDLSITFFHYAFEKSFLIDNGIYIEDADWLSEEGYDLIMAKLEALGCLEAYDAWFDTDMQTPIDTAKATVIAFAQEGYDMAAGEIGCEGTDGAEGMFGAVVDRLLGENFMTDFFRLDLLDAAEAYEPGADLDDDVELITTGDDVTLLAPDDNEYDGRVIATDPDAQEALVQWYDWTVRSWRCDWWHVKYIVLRSTWEAALKEARVYA